MIGLAFTALYILIFRFLIKKWDLPTPGREAVSEDIKLFTKKDYKEKNTSGTEAGAATEGNRYRESAAIYLEAFGGADNIAKVNNCATRLRITVNDAAIVAADDAFRAGGAHGVVRNGTAFQVIVGLDVPQVRDQFEQLLEIRN